MAMESSLQEAAIRNHVYEVASSANIKNLKKSDSTNIMGSDFPPSPGFDCNICLDFVQDPVVTLCGHLYCWPCIYKWLSVHSASSEYSDQPEPQCPVCKSLISESTLVPLYGRGKNVKTTEGKSSNLDLVTPPRPPAPVSWHMIPTSTSQQRTVQPQDHHVNHFSQPPQLHHRNFLNQPQSYYYTPSPRLGFRGYNHYTPTNSVHPVVGMFGDMVYERISGNSMMNTYDYRNLNNSYVSHISPRLRRQIMQADKSLTRICFFLFCCIILCLLLF